MVKYSKAIAGNTDLDTAQAFVISLDGQNLGLASIISAQGDDAFALIRSTSADLEESFFSSNEPISLRFPLLFNLLKDKLNSLSNLEILLVAWKEDLLYIQSLGAHNVYLLRENHVNLISSPETHLSEISNLLSGHLKNLDRVLICSKSIKELGDIYPEKLIKSETEELDEDLSEIARQMSMLPSIAAARIDFNLEDSFLPQGENAKDLTILHSEKFKFREFLKEVVSKINFKIVVPIILILSLSIVGGLVWFNHLSKEREKEKKILAIISLVNQKQDEARNLQSSDIQEALKKIEDGKTLLQEGLAIKTTPQLKSKQEELEKQKTEILNQNKISDWPIFLDLNLVKKGFSAKRMSYNLGKVVLLDTEQKSLMLLDLKLKSNKILSGAEQMGKVEEASINGDSSFTYSFDKGIVKIDNPTQKVSANIKPDTEWGRISDIVGFASNIYLLDTGNPPAGGHIWKYVPIASGYSDKFKYFKDEAKIDLSGAKKMLIDSSIWVLKVNVIEKFTFGDRDFFSVSNLDKPIGLISTFFVSDDTDNIYIVDQLNSRLVVLKKNGQYISQMGGDKFKTIDDLVVDEKGKKVYLLEKDKIYQIELK